MSNSNFVKGAAMQHTDAHKVAILLVQLLNLKGESNILGRHSQRPESGQFGPPWTREAVQAMEIQSIDGNAAKKTHVERGIDESSLTDCCGDAKPCLRDEAAEEDQIEGDGDAEQGPQFEVDFDGADAVVEKHAEKKGRCCGGAEVGLESLPEKRRRHDEESAIEVGYRFEILLMRLEQQFPHAWWLGRAQKDLNDHINYDCSRESSPLESLGRLDSDRIY